MPSGPIGWIDMEKGVIRSHVSDGEGSTSTSDTQAVESHRLDGDGERLHVTRKPSSPIGQMQKDRSETFMTNCKHQVTRKPSGPIGRMEMGRWVPQVEWRWAVRSHRSDGDGKWSNRYT